MFERVIASFLVGWWSFFNRGNQRNFRTDQLQERVQNHIIDCCWLFKPLLFPVIVYGNMVVAITNQFGIEVLPPPKKCQLSIVFSSTPKNTHPKPTKKHPLGSSEMVFYPSPRPTKSPNPVSFTGTEERYLLITWFCHPCDTMHAEVPPDDPEHFCPF